MKLHYQRSGQGEPLVILHGLFGTLENWGSHIKNLSEHYDVIAADLRNHGRSPHSPEISYPIMANDVVELLDDLELEEVNLLGHSMGGKVAMQIALNHGARVKKLMVADIAPVVYPPHHEQVFAGLFNVNLASLTSRSDADKQLQAFIDEPGIRAFLLKNLYRNDESQFAWRMNLNALKSEYDHIAAAPSGIAFSGPTRFIKGGSSNYVRAEHTEAVKLLFPNADVKVIAEAGHWLHAEKPALFLRQVEQFFS
ncbi:alpha/beta fold hydrolase [Nitrincola schmidtii]|uniref:alpha/beta fold hydrolase n=1 Tax=Nitrincola schmidtii TaxID=1730894 RepID=UPI00124DB759|nr:alpha/beta fold hydrolase [Nitrincola schmidtii]